MTLKERLTKHLSAGKKRKRFVIIAMLSVWILLSGFSWTWFIEFTSLAIFPFDEAVHTALILDFDDLVNVNHLQTYLTEPLIAEQLMDGIQSNLSGQIYNAIELPEIREESLGPKIIRIIFDRIFT